MHPRQKYWYIVQSNVCPMLNIQLFLEQWQRDYSLAHNNSLLLRSDNKVTRTDRFPAGVPSLSTAIPKWHANQIRFISMFLLTRFRTSFFERSHPGKGRGPTAFSVPYSQSDIEMCWINILPVILYGCGTRSLPERRIRDWECDKNNIEYLHNLYSA